MFKKIILFLVLYIQFKLNTRVLTNTVYRKESYIPSSNREIKNVYSYSSNSPTNSKYNNGSANNRVIKYSYPKIVSSSNRVSNPATYVKNGSTATTNHKYIHHSSSTTYSKKIVRKYTIQSTTRTYYKSSKSNITNYAENTLLQLSKHKNYKFPADKINCIESKIKNLLNKNIKEVTNKNQYYKDLFSYVKQRLLNNCKSYLEIIKNKNNKTKEVEELSTDIKEFLVGRLSNKANFEILLDNIEKKNKEDSEICKFYFISEIKKMYHYLYTKGDYWKNYQINFLSLLNDLKNIKAKNELDTIISSSDYFELKYEKYIPFLYKYIEYIPFLKHIMIIRTTNITELFKLLKSLIIEYMAFDSTTTSKDRHSKFNEINEILFIILLIKNQLNELNNTKLPFEFYWFVLKNPTILNDIITHINNNGDNMFEKSLLNNNYYNLNIKGEIIVYLRTNVIIRIKDEYFNTNNDIYKQIPDKNTKKNLKNLIFDLIYVYDDYIYFMEKILLSKKSNVDKNDKKEDLKKLFIKEVNSYNIKDNTIKEHSENFYKFILHNSDNLISSKNNDNDDNLKKILIDITVGISDLDENAMLKLNESNTGEIIRIIIELVEKVNVIKNKENKNIFVKNIIKIMFIGMLSKNNSKYGNQFNYKKHFYDILIKFDYMLKELINEYSYYEKFLKDFINKNSTNVISKTDFLGINNESKLPKGDKNDQFIIYELIGHFIFKANFENYKKIIKEFVGNCDTFIYETKRKNYLEKFILTEFNEDKREVINLKISDNNKVKLTKINNQEIIDLLPIFLNNNINKFIKISTKGKKLKILEECPYDPNIIENFNNKKGRINNYTPSLPSSSEKIYVKTNTYKKIDFNPEHLDFRL